MIEVNGKKEKVDLCFVIVTRNGMIAWKHGPNWPFHPFFFTGHQNVNKAKSRVARTVYGLMFLPFYKIIVSFFSFLWQVQTKQDQTVL